MAGRADEQSAFEWAASINRPEKWARGGVVKKNPALQTDMDGKTPCESCGAFYMHFQYCPRKQRMESGRVLGFSPDYDMRD